MKEKCKMLYNCIIIKEHTKTFFLPSQLSSMLLAITKHSSAYQFVSYALLFIQNKQQCKKEL